MAQGDVFDLVQQFDKMRQGLGNGGGGVGRPMEKPRPVGEAYQHRFAQYGQPQVQTQRVGLGTPAPSAGGLKLVNYGGKQFDESIVPHLQQIQGRFGGLRLTSGYRDPAHNARVNGVKNSRHLTGRAVDFVGSAKDMQEAAAYAKSMGGRVLIHNAGSGQHLHVEWGDH